MPKCILTEQGGKGGGSSSNFSIQKMVITTPPTVTSYLSGDKFSKTGMVITGSYGADGIAFDTMTADVTDNVSVTPETLTDGITQVKLSLLSAEGKEVSVFQPVTVHAKLTSLSATAPSIEYEIGDTFPSTYQVTANYSDGTTQTVDATCENVNLTAVGIHSIVLSYTDSTIRDTTCTTTMSIDVKRKSIDKPVLKSGVELTFTGNTYDIIDYLDNYNSSYYTVVDNIASAAGEHTTSFTPTANYRWGDTHSTDAYELKWNIASLLIEPPIANVTSFIFNGSPQGPTFTYDTTNVTISGDISAETNTNTYKAIFTLKDPASTAWKGGGGNTPKEISWTINKLELAVPSSSNLSFTYDGNPHIPDFTPTSSYITVGGDSASKTNAGNYNTTFTLTDVNNVQWADKTTEVKDLDWSIARATISVKPTPSSLTYNGAEQLPTWSNHNSTQLTKVENQTSHINKGSYSSKFTPTANYQWASSISSDTTAGVDVAWSIAAKSVTPTVSKTTLAFSASSTTDSFTVGCGDDTNFTYTVISDNTAVATVTKNGNTVNVSADGHTAGNATITLTFTVSSDNYVLSKSTLTVSASATYWSPGSSGSSVDATWFAGLKNFVQGATKEEIAAKLPINTEYSVTLNSAVLGTTTHKIKVIGICQDGDHTVTFQTSNCLAQYTQFGSNAQWIGSTARAKCQEYYNAFPGKASIKTVKKGTCPDCNNNRNGNVTYNDETVFLLSEREYNLDSYAPISTANSNVNKAECCQGYNEPYAAYTDNASRIKKNGDSGSAQYHWERSRYYNASSSIGVCGVGSTGGANYIYYYLSHYLAPAFVIG